MERRVEKSLLVMLLVLSSCLLLVSSVPMTRSLRLGTITQHPLAPKLPSPQKQETTTGAAMNLGRPEARMDVEVNDYPMPGANDDHDPGRH